MKRPFQPIEKFEPDKLDKQTEQLIEQLAQQHAPKSPKWTEREDAILRKAYGKLDYRTISKKLLPKRTTQAIEHRASRLDLKEK